MTLARSMQINLDVTKYYHCISRCVRRGFLCGFDNYAKKDYSHRRNWVAARLKYLLESFSIKLVSYAIMSNHYHLILAVERESAKCWSDEEIVERWKRIYPTDARINGKDKGKITKWREQLFNISFFMQCMNEYLAKKANKEDDCKGRFWEGRFKSQALLDEGALLCAMAYVDLNPIRAGIVNSPEDSDYTSVQERIQFVQNQETGPHHHCKHKFALIDGLEQPPSLVPFSNQEQGAAKNAINFRLSDYLELIDVTGRILREDKVGVIPQHLLPILERIQIKRTGWFTILRKLTSHFYHAVGHESRLFNFSKLRNRKVKGFMVSREIYYPT